MTRTSRSRDNSCTCSECRKYLVGSHRRSHWGDEHVRAEVEVVVEVEAQAGVVEAEAVVVVVIVEFVLAPIPHS